MRPESPGFPLPALVSQESRLMSSTALPQDPAPVAPHLVQNWSVEKPLARSRGGIVAAQNRIAARAGARILAAGGNAVDAAVATGFALAACEPWNSGLGGIGYMLVYRAAEDRVYVVDFGPMSPRGIDPSDFPLTGGTTTDLFTWPSVKDDRNVHGPWSFAIPGHVEGLGFALERFGSRSLSEVMAPAIELAEEGMPVDWYLTLRVAAAARDLARYPSTRAVWMSDGLPPVTPPGAEYQRLQLTGLAQTLRAIARGGRREFYEGEVGRSIVEDTRRMGGVLAAEDLAGFRARLLEPLELDYRGARLALAPGLTAGPTLAQVLGSLVDHKFVKGPPTAESFVAWAQALREAYSARLAGMGEGTVQVTEIAAGAEARSPSCTTHLNVIDGEGNMVALTQTLLSVFGSRVVLPGTGVLMNNGMNWFDPRPGSPNAIGPGRRALTNMCPVIARRNGKPWFAIGASGGRRIMPAVMQLSSLMIDHGLDLEKAFHQPRIDASGNDYVGVDPRLPVGVRKALAARFPVRQTELAVYPTNFACPSAVLKDPLSGNCFGVTDVLSPWSGAVSEDEV